MLHMGSSSKLERAHHSFETSGLLHRQRLRSRRSRHRSFPKPFCRLYILIVGSLRFWPSPCLVGGISRVRSCAFGLGIAMPNRTPAASDDAWRAKLVSARYRSRLPRLCNLSSCSSDGQCISFRPPFLARVRDVVSRRSMRRDSIQHQHPKLTA